LTNFHKRSIKLRLGELSRKVNAKSEDKVEKGKEKARGQARGDC
jgi:hypothetical protein